MAGNDNEIEATTSKENAHTENDQPPPKWKFWAKKSSGQDGEGKKRKGLSALFCGADRIFKRGSNKASGPTDPKLMKRRKTKGKVVFDNTTNKEMWQRMVDNSIVGTGRVSKAAICNLATGAICACNPQGFTPTVDQVERITSIISDNTIISGGSELIVADMCFQYNCAKIDDYLLASNPNDSQGGMAVYKANTCVVIGVYDRGGSDAKQLLTEMREYFTDQGF